MRILALEEERAGAQPDGFVRHLREEAAGVWNLYTRGLVREAFFREDTHTAVLLLEAEDLSAARTALDALPLVREGLITFRLIPLTPYTGFARLFG